MPKKRTRSENTQDEGSRKPRIEQNDTAGDEEARNQPPAWADVGIHRASHICGIHINPEDLESPQPLQCPSLVSLRTGRLLSVKQAVLWFPPRPRWRPSRLPR